MELNNRLLELGLSQNEIEELGLENALCYYRFHHKKNNGVSSVLFSKLPEEKLSQLQNLANSSGLKINSRISTGLTFFCHENEKEERLKKAQENGTLLLAISEFEKIFSIQEYSLKNSNLIFDSSINNKFRIANPLSNFDQENEIYSFSLNSNQTYNVNLYRQTCTCGDFINSGRSNYKQGDIRRFCKHLMQDYSKSFGLDGLSKLQEAMIEYGHPAKHHLEEVNLQNVEFPVYINRDDRSDWWNIYISTDGRTYTKYGYDPEEERFAYDDKPHGYVKELREKLKSYNNQLFPQKNKTPKNKESNDTGCAGVLMLSVFVLVASLYFL